MKGPKFKAPKGQIKFSTKKIMIFSLCIHLNVNYAIHEIYLFI